MPHKFNFDCCFCPREFNSVKELSSHVFNGHKTSWIEYREFFAKEIGFTKTCEGCGNEFNYFKLGRFELRKFCSVECRSIFQINKGGRKKGWHHTDKAKRKISENRDPQKGIDYEERYGEKRAKEIKKKLSIGIKRGHKKYGIISPFKGKTWEELYGIKRAIELKNNMSKRNANNKNGRGRFSKVEFDDTSIIVRSSWEKKLALWLIENEIRFFYEPKRFSVDSSKSYLPDFYLPDFKLWVEVKGRPNCNDWPKVEKWAKKKWGLGFIVLKDKNTMIKKLSNRIKGIISLDVA